MSKKKKIIILVSMVLLLVATTTLNIVLGIAGSDKATGGDGVVASGNFFTDFRADRKTSRDQQMLYLDSIISEESLSDAAKADASNQKLALTKLMETETILEGVLKANGFDDAVVSISADSSNVYVIVKAAELSTDQSQDIFNLILDERKDIDMNSIRITPVA